MCRHIDRERIRAWLDDLAMISQKHGLVVDSVDGVNFSDIDSTFDGYNLDPTTPVTGDYCLSPFRCGTRESDAHIVSMDLNRLSGHQKLKMMR